MLPCPPAGSSGCTCAAGCSAAAPLRLPLLSLCALLLAAPSVGRSVASRPASVVSTADPAVLHAEGRGAQFTISSSASRVLPGVGGLARRLAVLLPALWRWKQWTAGARLLRLRAAALLQIHEHV